MVDLALRKHGVRDRVHLLTSGQIATPIDVVIAMSLGADGVEVDFLPRRQPPLNLSQLRRVDSRLLVALAIGVLASAVLWKVLRNYEFKEEGYAGVERVFIWLQVITACYVAFAHGANDVANNMGPAVGGKVLTVLSAVLIAAVCESAGALLAGGDVVRTVSKGIISPGEQLSISEFQTVMLSSLLAAALWINLATILSAPVSTTHSIVGGVLGAGIAAAGLSIVNWSTMAKIAASWFISPVLGAIIAAAFLLFIKVHILNVENRLQAAQRWVPICICIFLCHHHSFHGSDVLKETMDTWKTFWLRNSGRNVSRLL